MNPNENTPRELSRFWSKVNRDGPIPSHVPHLGKCWVWCGSVSRNGYGIFSDGRSRVAHRWIFESLNGKIGRLMCCHKCDNRLCVNPEHLFRGTAKDIMDDTKEIASLRQQLEVEKQIVNRIWKALGISTYDQAKPLAIDEHVVQLKAQLEAKTKELASVEAFTSVDARAAVVNLVQKSSVVVKEVTPLNYPEWRDFKEALTIARSVLNLK